MDDMASKITEFLEDDRNVELLKTFSGFMKSEKKDSEEQSGRTGAGPAARRRAGRALWAEWTPARSWRALGKFGSEDDRVRLLKALRPFISEKRRENLDSVTKILRLTQVISLFDDDLKLF